MDSSGQNTFSPLVEQQASHTFHIHTVRTEQLFQPLGETQCLPSLPDSPMLFQRGSNLSLKDLLSEVKHSQKTFSSM